MSSQEFLWLTIGIGLAIAVLFIWRHKSVRPPSRLFLRKKVNAVNIFKGVMDKSTRSVGEEGGLAKNLNVLFMYNGHHWDAHEILGVAPGSSLQACEEAYKKVLAKTDAQSKLFVDTAYQAIVDDFKNRRG